MYSRVSDAGVAMFDYVERGLTLMHDLEGHVRRSGPLRGLIDWASQTASRSFALPTF